MPLLHFRNCSSRDLFFFKGERSSAIFWKDDRNCGNTLEGNKEFELQSRVRPYRIQNKKEHRTSLSAGWRGIASCRVPPPHQQETPDESELCDALLKRSRSSSQARVLEEGPADNLGPSGHSMGESITCLRFHIHLFKRAE